MDISSPAQPGRALVEMDTASRPGISVAALNNNVSPKAAKIAKNTPPAKLCNLLAGFKNSSSPRASASLRRRTITRNRFSWFLRGLL